MITIRPAQQRGHADHGWLKTYHTFSFGSYHDPEHMQFRALRVMNEDAVEPGQGFGMHPHRDMEIVTYVLEGALAHRDSLGNQSMLHAGELQRMTAGTGIVHSEFNPSTTDSVHFYQVWLLPSSTGLEPSYEQQHFAADARHNRLQLVAAPEGAEGALRIHQDARVYLGNLDPGQILRPSLDPRRFAWLQVLRGQIELDGLEMSAGDGAAIEQAASLVISSRHESELLLFDLA